MVANLKTLEKGTRKYTKACGGTGKMSRSAGNEAMNKLNMPELMR